MKKKTQNQQPDTRQLFYKLMARKPASFEELPVANCLTTPQIEALKRMPVIDVSGREPPDDFNRDLPLEFVAQFDDAFFYVDTEGFRYCRYAFRLPDNPQNLLPPPFKVWVVVERRGKADAEPEELDLPFGPTAEFADEADAVGFASRVHEHALNLLSPSTKI